MSVIVLCPTRNRPDNAWEVLRSLDATAHDSATRVLFIVDQDDPQIEIYRASIAERTLDLLEVPRGRPGMADGLNQGVDRLLADRDISGDIVGFVGDDHRFRTPGWDVRFKEWVAGHPVAMMYAYDGARTDIPTQVFMTGNIVKALGFMVAPPLRHLYIDNYWKQLGDALGVIQLFPDILIEHMHPFYGKAKMDAEYARVNDEKVYDADRQGLQAWHNTGEFAKDVERVRAIQ